MITWAQMLVEWMSWAMARKETSWALSRRRGGVHAPRASRCQRVHVAGEDEQWEWRWSRAHGKAASTGVGLHQRTGEPVAVECSDPQ